MMAPNMIAETIVIVDYGAGNLNSVKKAFDYLGANVVVTSEPEKVATAGKIVLPGVGHFSAWVLSSTWACEKPCCKARAQASRSLGSALECSGSSRAATRHRNCRVREFSRDDAVRSRRR